MGEAGASQCRRRRRKRKSTVFKMIQIMAAVGMLVYGFFGKAEEFEFREDTKDLRTQMAQNKTPTNVCYIKDKKTTFPYVTSLCFGLLGLLLAPAVHCLCDFLQGLFQLPSRSRRDISNCFKECFSVIRWKPIIAIAVVDVVLTSALKGRNFKLEDLMLIISGIGFYPLLAYLLSLNPLASQEKGPAYAIAYNYHTQYLEKAWLMFNRSFHDSNTAIQGQRSCDGDMMPRLELSLKKIILLFSHDYEKSVKLMDLDNHIDEIDPHCYKSDYNFPIYRLNYDKEEYDFVIRYADEPLDTLKKMCKSKHELVDQVDLLYDTLSECLEGDKCANHYILVLIPPESVSNLQGGGLVKLIMSHVELDECTAIVNMDDTDERMDSGVEED